MVPVSTLWAVLGDTCHEGTITLLMVNKIWIEMKKVAVILAILLTFVLVAALCSVTSLYPDYERQRALRADLNTHYIIYLTEERPGTQAAYTTQTAQVAEWKDEPFSDE